MAEGGVDIELDNLDREQEAENNEEGEDTGFNNDKNDSILIIDTSNPVFIRPSESGIPNPRRDAGIMKRHIIYDQKQFLKTGLGITVNKGDGPNSTLLYNELRVTFGKDEKINGAKYKGKKILILKNGKMNYSTNKVISQYVNEFKELLTKVDAEHQKTPVVLVEEQVGVDLPRYAMDDIMSNVSDILESTVDERMEDFEENTVITTNELRVLRGILNVKGDSSVQKIEALKIESTHWRKMAQEEEDNGNAEKAKLYETIAETSDLKADEIRLRLNQKPQSEEVISMLEEEARVNDLTRFEKFKKWARENIGSLSAVAISIAGILTTVIMAGRNAVKRGAQAVSKFAKAVANLAKKFGPELAALGNFIAKILTLGAKGIMWLSQNLWLLALALTYFVYNEYKDYRRKKKP